jgi:two-component system, chemotaxis family, chemotaxis protein CheY
VIIVSGHAERRRVLEARDAGANEFLVKPISAKALYQRIVSVVLQPRPYVKTKVYFGPDRRRIPDTNYHGENRRGSDADQTQVIKQNSLLSNAG